MKYCTNCGVSRQSWEEARGISSCNNASDRCWTCDKWSLTPSCTSLVRASDAGSSIAQTLARRFATDNNPNATINHKVEAGNVKDGEYYCEILQADKSSGCYYYQKTEYKSNR